MKKKEKETIQNQNQKTVKNNNKAYFIQSILFSLLFLAILILKLEMTFSLVFLLISIVLTIIYGYRYFKDNSNDD